MNCPNCGSRKVDIDCGLNICQKCNKAWKAVPIKKPTVFQQITVSPKVLAKKLVYFDSSVCDDDGIGYPWCSTLIDDGGHFETEEKAIAATVERLKEVEK